MNSVHKLLTVVIPTYNRPCFLEQSISSLLTAYSRSLDLIEFLVINNGSTLELNSQYSQVLSRFPSVKYLYYQDPTSISESLERAVKSSSTEYIHIFGDDDIAFPFLGEAILPLLLSCSPGLLYLNRLIGNEDLSSITEVAHSPDPCRIVKDISLQSFIEDFRHWPGFIPSVVFKKSVWLNGYEQTVSPLPGYDFLEYLYRGLSMSPITYISSPMLIQRRGKQTWKDYWPLYYYHSLPTILHRMDVAGLSNKALTNMRNNDLSLPQLVADMVLAKSLPHIYKSSFWKVLLNSQLLPPLHLSLVSAISILPSSVCMFIITLIRRGGKYA